MSKPPQILACSVAAYLFAAAAPGIYAQTNGTWSAAAGGSWATTTNWAGGTIPAGVGAIADFSTVDITANATVNLDGSRTVGSLKFADLTAGNDWTLATGTAGSILTLDVAT